MSTLQKSNNIIRCMIVDDDPFMQDLLSDKLAHFKKIEVIAVASSATDAIEKLQQFKPELLFLDVEMPEMTGFEMLERLEEIDFKTIFVTSYSHYAIKAIRFNALDYLLKPIDLQELRNAIKRFEKNRGIPEKGKIKRAIYNRKVASGDKLLTLNTQEGELRLPLKDILYIQGERNYSYIHTLPSKKSLVSKTLSALEEILVDDGFFRCHKSFIVNGSHIHNKLKSTYIEVNGGLRIPVSRRRLKQFKAWLGE